MTAPVRIGVLGCAGIARRRMLPAFSAAPDVELVAVASRNPARARELADEHGCRAVEGYEALLADESVQAVYVPVPAALHAEWVEASLRAGKHVLAEKPLTIDAVVTARLVALAAAGGLVLRENVMFVHHRQHEAVHELIAAGSVGELRSLQASFTVPRRSDDDIRYRPDLGGGALWDTGVYPVRTALHFLGPDLRVAGAVQRLDPVHRVDIGGAALLETGAGISAQLNFGLDDDYRSEYEIRGTTGVIRVEHAYTPLADQEPAVLVRADGTARRVELPADDQVANTVAAFVAAVRTGAAPDDGIRRQAELLNAIRSAAVHR